MIDELEITSSDRLVRELTVATNACLGVIAIRCPETEIYRVVDEIYAMAMSQGTNFRVHTTEAGWMSYATVDPEDTRAKPFNPIDPAESDKATAEIGKAFQKLFETQPDDPMDEGFFVMLDTYFSFGEMLTQTRLRKQAQRALRNSQRLFLIVPNSAEIPDAVQPLIHLVDYGYPSRSELSDALDDVLDSIEDSERPTISDYDRAMIVSNGQGMTVNSFETAVAVAITEYGEAYENFEGFGPADIVQSIRGYKTALLSKTNVLELQPEWPEADIGGLDLFKAWMHQRKMTYTDTAKENNVTPSRGALVVGPPGTGKSAVAKASGAILNLPVIRFDVGRVFGQYIGQSEGAMRTVLAMIDAMAPCVLMLDEIDKGFSGMGGSNDNGTTQRVFGTFLTWMQERDQINRPVFLIMTANRVAGLPPELLRKGRVDEIWSVNVPNDEEREQIINIHLRKRGQTLDKGDLKAAVRISSGLVGAEIEALIEDALVLSLSNEEVGITYELLEEAKSNLKEMAKTREAEFKAMSEWAKQNARPSSSPMRKSDTIATKSVRRSGKRVRAKVQRQ